MSFTNPIWLYGLLGLLVPVAIHLWSKKEGQTIKVGSIQFFPESETRQSSKLHLNEIFLLILRSLIVALLVMLIAQPILISAKKKDKATVLIAPALLAGDQFGSILDTVLAGDYNVKLLTKGLPDLDQKVEQDYPDSDYLQLISEIEGLASAEIIVFSTSRMVAFKGRIPASSKRLTWNTIPPRYDAAAVLKATIYDGQYNVYLGNSSETQTEITRISFSNPNERSDLQFRNSGLEVKLSSQDNWVAVEAVAPTLVSINYDQEFKVDAQLLSAAFRAIEVTNGIPIQVEMTLISNDKSATDNAEIQVWLSDKQFVDVNDVKTLIYNNNMYENKIIKTSVRRNQYWLNRRLSVANMTVDDLPEYLMKTVFKDELLEQQINSLDQRAIAVQMIQPLTVAQGTLRSQEQLAIPHYYWIVFMALMVFERFVSFQRKQ